MFQLIVFDLDGTLVDSKRDLANATNTLLVECGAAPLAEDRIGRMVGDGVVAVRMLADAVVVEQPVAVAELDAFGDGVHVACWRIGAFVN